MGHDGGEGAAAGVPPKEPPAVVGVPVKFRLGTELLHPPDLLGVFRQVGLDGQAPFLLDVPKGLQQLLRAGGNEAGGQDGPGAPVPPFRFLQPQAGLPGGDLGGFLPQILGGVPIHVHLAHEGRQAAVLQQVHEQLSGLPVPGGEDAGPGDGAAGQAFHKLAIGRPGVVQVAVLGFLREGPGLEPLHQLQIHAGPPEGVLGGVGVEVHQTGEDQLVPVVCQGQSLIPFRQGLVHAPGDPLFTDHVGIRENGDLRPAAAVTDGPLQNKAVVHVQAPFLRVSR